MLGGRAGGAGSGGPVQGLSHPGAPEAPWPEVLGSTGGGTWAQLTSFRAWGDRRPASSGECWVTWGLRRTLRRPRAPLPGPASGSPCGQTRAGRRLPGARRSCSISVASVQPASVSAAARASGSRCPGDGGQGRQGSAFVPTAPLPAPGGSAAHRIFAAQHEAYLAAGVGGDTAVSVGHHREERLAELSHLLDEVQVQPLALTCGESRAVSAPAGRAPQHWRTPAPPPTPACSPWQQRTPSSLRAVFMSW